MLGGGGILGLEWIMGMLAGIEDATGFDLRDCEYFVGTSAGAIAAARLVGGRRPRRPPRTGDETPAATERETETPEDEEELEQRARLGAAALEAARRAGEWSLAVGSPLAPAALALTRPAGTLLRAGVLSRIRAPERTLDGLKADVAQYGARFDGRLRVACVERASGRRVMFGAPASPRATVPEAVAASCAVPWLFTPVTIAHREYVDGGVWSATNLDAAPAGRGTSVLCLNPTAGLGDSHTLVAVGRRLARSAVSVEAMALRRRGALPRTIAPDADSSAAMSGDFMDPEPRARVLAAGYEQGLREAPDPLRRGTPA